jgi:hypothetical protein
MNPFNFDISIEVHNLQVLIELYRLLPEIYNKILWYT